MTRSKVPFGTPFFREKWLMSVLFTVCLVLAIVMLCIVRKRETVSLNLTGVRKITSGEVCWQVIRSAQAIAVSYFGSDAVSELNERNPGLAKEIYFFVHSDDSETQLEVVINALRFRVRDQQTGTIVFFVNWQATSGFDHFLRTVQSKMIAHCADSEELVAA